MAPNIPVKAATAFSLRWTLRDHVEQLAANYFRFDKNGFAILVNTMQSEYILGEINAYGDHIHGLPLSNE